MDNAKPQLPTWLHRFNHVGIGGAVRFGWLSNDLSPTGVIGDPTVASALRGAELFASMIRNVGEQLAEISRFEFLGTLDASPTET
jgi:creatinine amidohydrolase